jgi:hypothetical protein
VSVTSEGAAEHIEQLAQRYLGTPYPWYGGRDQTRLILTIEPRKIHSMGWRDTGALRARPSAGVGYLLGPETGGAHHERLQHGFV